MARNTGNGILGSVGYVLLGIFGIAITAIAWLLTIFIFAIIGALFGAVAGWTVSITPVLGDLVLDGFLIVGLKNPNLVSLGAMLGFVAGFFKSYTNQYDFNQYW